LRRYKAKRQDSLLSGEGRSLGAKISGGRGRPCGIFFDFYKTRYILLSDSANCTVLRAIVLTQYRLAKIRDAKNRHLGTIAQLCRAESSQLRHVSTVEKNC